MKVVYETTVTDLIHQMECAIRNAEWENKEINRFEVTGLELKKLRSEASNPLGVSQYLHNDCPTYRGIPLVVV